MKLHEHIVEAYDVKIVGPEPEVHRFRKALAELRLYRQFILDTAKLAEDDTWSHTDVVNEILEMADDIEKVGPL